MESFNRSVLKELNEARTGPSSYAEKVRNQLSYYRGSVIHKPNQIPIQTQEGQQAVMECIQYLKKAQRAPELELSSILSRAAQDHCNDIGPKGITGHDGSDGSSMSDRIEKHGSWDITIGENIDFGNDDPSEIVMALLIDDGVPNRGHRENIMNPQFRAVGIGFGAHTVYRHCCTMDFAGGINDCSSRSEPVRAPAKMEFDDEEIPEGVVEVNTSIETTTKNGKKTTKEVKTFTYSNGSTETRTTIKEEH